ncbi:MAG: EAL domain-containing protein, partial [Clostridia bacterium]|nr:EAL domain-containing protein [Clostridia bacterium]
EIAEKYKTEIATFYDSYKQAGLYRQAKQVQNNVDATNNKDQDVLKDYKLEDYTNTYDDIVLSYVDRAVVATDAAHSVNYYNMIIDSYVNDTVPLDEKAALVTKNEKIMKEIEELSAKYSALANATINELYASDVNTDLEYLILPEVSADKPIALICIFLIMLTFGMAVIAVLVIEIIKKNVDIDAIAASVNEEKEEKIVIDTSEMDELHQLLYQQYLDDFSEFYLVYQPMISEDADAKEHKEVFIRWQSPDFGMVSPAKIIKGVSDFGIFKQLNDWIVGNVCQYLSDTKKKNKPLPIVHINCPYNEINDFAIVDIIIHNLSKYDIPAENICLELVGKDISTAIEDIMLLEEMGIKICIDKFENSQEDQEILQAVKPNYIKMSLDILNSDMYATSDDDILEASGNMIKYFSEVIEKCHANGIKACICGIEKKAQDDIAKEMKFDYKQGYLYGKPERLF